MTETVSHATPTLELTEALVRQPSHTPDDAGCMEIIEARLAALGFASETVVFGDVKNLWSRKGTASPLLVFVGHTDVVPTGPLESWTSPPFTPTIRHGYLFGRGCADMKANIAAFITALERFDSKYNGEKGSIAILLTSDEEGPGVDGVARMVPFLSERQEKIDYCIVGEPSSQATVGDTIKNGRRGSLHAKVVVEGVQGHVAYPEKAINPIHKVAPALADLISRQWDDGNEFFPPTGFQITNLKAVTGSDNTTPQDLEMWLNFRFCTESSPEGLQAKVEAILNQHELTYEIEWRISGLPFLTSRGNLLEAVQGAITQINGKPATLSTAGGTSDGRFIAPTGAEIVELGLVNDTIHKVDECVSLVDLETLSKIYEETLIRLLA